MKRVAVIAQVKHHIEEARSIRQLAQTLIAQVEEDTQNKVLDSQIQIVAIVSFCQNIQLPSHRKEQPGATYFFVFLNVFC